jgi:hypothetical protein
MTNGKQPKELRETTVCLLYIRFCTRQLARYKEYQNRLTPADYYLYAEVGIVTAGSNG